MVALEAIVPKLAYWAMNDANHLPQLAVLYGENKFTSFPLWWTTILAVSSYPRPSSISETPRLFYFTFSS
jgi:hypothetical protein